MYDTVSYNGADYQTKDLDCLMNHYIIQNGWLYQNHREMEETGETYEFLGAILPKMRVKREYKTITAYTGDINIYDGEDIKCDEGVDHVGSYWHEITVSLINGQVIKMVHDIKLNISDPDYYDEIPLDRYEEFPTASYSKDELIQELKERGYDTQTDDESIYQVVSHRVIHDLFVNTEFNTNLYRLTLMFVRDYESKIA